jgi:uncharacterized SAM-binding protein YcdF (DUF218 family)
MGWFFPVSKVFEFLIAPSHVLLWLVLAAPGALLLGRARLARALGVAAAALFVLIGAAPLGSVLARPLEDRYPRRPLPAHIDGVVTLGAGLNTLVLAERGAPGTAPGVDRLVSTYELARRHAEARIVFSGGWGRYSDSIAARDDFLRMGLDPARLVLEGRSRNTYENLEFTRAIVRPRPGEAWVLATSAIQLPRAMNVARKLGWEMIPWPTDYRTARTWSEGWFEIGDNLRLTDEAVHEWLGLVAYGAAGLAGGQAPRSVHGPRG